MGEVFVVAVVNGEWRGAVVVDVNREGRVVSFFWAEGISQSNKIGAQTGRCGVVRDDVYVFDELTRSILLHLHRHAGTVRAGLCDIGLGFPPPNRY